MKIISTPFCIVLCAVLFSSCTTNTDYPGLTSCLQENKVIMFGASWCPHCADQKKLFGRSIKQMPYFECSPKGKQVPACDERGIASYPTWQFQPDTIEKLPTLALTQLLDGEVEKVKSSLAQLKKSINSDKKDALLALTAFEKKTETLLASDMSDFTKLTKLTSLTITTDGQVSEQPIYLAGRIAGVRTLEEIAVYAGCSDAYKTDLTTSSN